MKKIFTEMALVAMTVGMLFSGCKTYNPPDNPWTNHKEGSKQWFEDLTTGEEKDAIKEYDAKDFTGSWQLVATTETSPEGEINRYKDWLKNSEISRGYTQYFLQLFEDMSSAYSMYMGLYDGTPALRTSYGSWVLDGNKIVFHEKVYNSANGTYYWLGEADENYIVDLVEKDRLVFRHPGKREEKDVIYYEVYQRVAGLPEVTVKTALEKLTANPWKVVNDSILYYGYIEPEVEGGETKVELAHVDVNTLLAGKVLHFGEDGKLRITDKDGAEAVYAYESQFTGGIEGCQIHIISEEDPFHSPYGYLQFSIGIHEEAHATISSGYEVPEERQDPKYDYINAWLQVILEKVE